MRSRLSRRARATACSTTLDSGAIPVIGGVLPDVLPFCHCGAQVEERQREGGGGVTKRMMRNWGWGKRRRSTVDSRQSRVDRNRFWELCEQSGKALNREEIAAIR